MTDLEELLLNIITLLSIVGFAAGLVWFLDAYGGDWTVEACDDCGRRTEDLVTCDDTTKQHCDECVHHCRPCRVAMRAESGC